jgi:hypothetical protein
MEDMKLYLINSATFLISLTDIELWLKIALLILTIVYTIQRIKNERNNPRV